MITSVISTKINTINALTERVRKLKSEGQDAGMYISGQASRSFTRSWKETTEQPIDLRRAKAYAEILKDSAISIRAGELIVGSQTKYIRGADPIAATDPFKILKQIQEGQIIRWGSVRGFASIEDEEAKILKEDALYWTNALPPDLITEEVRREFGEEHFNLYFEKSRVFGLHGPMRGVRLGMSADLNLRVVRDGLTSVINRAKAELRKTETLPNPQPDNLQATYHKQVLLRSIIITCEATIDFAKRHSELAKIMATQESNSQRRSELEQIAERCNRVPADPPRNFAEAVQCIQFLYLGLRKEIGGSISLGRLDQYLYPFYKKDLEEGKITAQEAAELLGCFLVKMNELEDMVTLFEDNQHLPVPGTIISHVTIGGLTKEGRDATNELSWLILEAVRQLKFPFPAVYIRYHNGMRHEFLMKALETNKDYGGGNPAFLNDQLGTARLLSQGIEMDDAIDWVASGCLGYHIPHANPHPNYLIGHINLPKVFEIMLNNGVDPRTMKKLGLQTGDVTRFTSIDDFYKAFETQVDRFVEIAIKDYFITKSIKLMEEGNGPLSSVMIEDCIKKGLGPNEGGQRYPSFTTQIVSDRGCTDVADSLAAIKKLVFDDKKLTINELLGALKDDWAGKEEIRQMCLKAPKYGNDDDYADTIFNYVSLKVQEIILSKRDPFTGGRLGLVRPAAVGHVHFGEVTGALPSGRKAWTSQNDAALSPMPGADIKGPTALINSATKANHAWEENGITLNMKLARSILETRENFEKTLSLIRTFFNQGGWHIQFNILNSDDLVDAKRNPEKWRSLIVRVAGYSAYFVDLPDDLQNEIINRTLHSP